MPTKLPAPGDPKALYVMDLSGYVFRAYHAVAALSNSSGEPTHATLGVTNMLNALVRNQKPTHLAVAMDSTTDTFRHTMYPQYKANRPPPPPDLAQQMARCREVAEAYAIPVLQQDGVEADDLIATCVAMARAHGFHTIVCSGDKDLLQLVAPDVTMWDAMRSRVFGREEVIEKWGVPPERVRDLLSLMGDSSDNIPGVAHVGEKTAAKLLAEHNSLDGIYQNIAKIKGKTKEYLEVSAANARLSYELIGLKSDVPMTFDVEALKYGGWDNARLKALFKKLEFNKLADAIDATPVSQAPKAVVSVVVATPVAEATVTAAVYEAVLTVEALDEAIARCREARGFAVDTETTSLETWRAELVGVSLSWRVGHGVYIPIGHRVMTDPKQLPRELVLNKLRPLFADATVKKFGQHIKYDETILARAGVPVAGYEFDTMLASYLIDPERHTHKLEEIARSELGYDMMTYEAVTKRSKGSVTFDEVDIATATRYSAEDSEVVSRLVERLRPKLESEGLWSLMQDVEVPLSHVLGRMEAYGVLVDVAFLKSLSNKVGTEITRVEQECHTISGKPFNVNAPRQLETILFDELKLPAGKKTKTGGRSTDAEVLEELSEKHPLPAKILEVRSLAKLQGTYLDALPSLVDKVSRIHTSYGQAVAATGRISSSNPNLQNIPIRTTLGREIRRAFVAPPGCTLLSADYSQIELRVLAHLSHDAILVDAFQRAEDVHARTAMEIFKVGAAEVTRDMRAKAKTTNFAVIYGQGESALSRQLGISKEEATEFIAKYFHTFAGLKKYLDSTIETARSGEGVRTLLGRRRFLPDLHSSNRGLRLTAERMANNTPIQGTAADIIKLAMIQVDRRLTQERMASKMVLTVHDELVFEVPEGERATLEPLVRETMQGVMKLSVPLVVECGWGANWGDAH
jgi:DNA polymerase I